MAAPKVTERGAWDTGEGPLIDIGDGRLVNGRYVGKLSTLGDTITLYDPDSGRLDFLPVGSKPAADIVMEAGGPDAFSMITYPNTGAIIWLRRSMLRGVYSYPPELTSDGSTYPIVQMVWDRPVADPWPPKRRMPPDWTVSFMQERMTIEDVGAMIGNKAWVFGQELESGFLTVPSADRISSAVDAVQALAQVRAEVVQSGRAAWWCIQDRWVREGDKGRSRLCAQGDRPVVAGGEPALASLLVIDLAELEDAAALGFPEDGSLTFLFDAAAEPWGFEAHDADRFSVRYAQAADAADYCSDSGFTLSLQRGVVLPPIDSTDGRTLALETEEQEEAYLGLLAELYGEPGFPGGVPGTWLGGHPYQLQDDMQEQCAEMAEKAWGIESEPAEWRLLLQLASESAANMSWGEDGFLYYWIRESDLAARDFSHVWCILQTM